MELKEAVGRTKETHNIHSGIRCGAVERWFPADAKITTLGKEEVRTCNNAVSLPTCLSCDF
jgi:hypothetical protein